MVYGTSNGPQNGVGNFLRSPCQGKFLRIVTGLDVGHNLDGVSIFDLWQPASEPSRRVFIGERLEEVSREALDAEMDAYMADS